MIRSRIHHGSLAHHRGGALKNNFRYPVYTIVLDLDEIDDLSASLRLFSLDHTNLFSLWGTDYALVVGVSSPGRRSLPLRSLKERVLALLRDSGSPLLPDRIELVTQLRVLGYLFNPVSFFIGYHHNQLVSVVAEVNNTHGQTFAYILDERCRTSVKAVEGRDVVGFKTKKQFFVSPFIDDRDVVYHWEFPFHHDPNRLDIRMSLARSGKGGRFFSARLSSISLTSGWISSLCGRDRVPPVTHCAPFSDRSLITAMIRYPLLPALITSRIHLQAARLYRLGLQYRRPSQPTDVKNPTTGCPTGGFAPT